MNILEQSRQGYTVFLKFEISPVAVELGVDRAFREMSKSARIPGFRKGKITRGLFVKHYGLDVLIREAIPEVVNRGYMEAIRSLQLAVVDFPRDVQISPYDPAEPLVVNCEVDVEPVVTLGKYKGLVATRVSEVADVAKVDAQIQELFLSYLRILRLEHFLLFVILPISFLPSIILIPV